MLETNPFAALAAFMPPAVMQVYLVAMAVLVAAGTLSDIIHKGSAKYFFTNWGKASAKGRPVGGGEALSIAVKTALVDVAASGEFCNARRRLAHLLTMYGFILYVAATIVMVFGASSSALWPKLWWLG